MDRYEKLRLIWPSLLPILPSLFYLQFGVLTSLIIGLMILPIIYVVPTDKRLYENKAAYFKYCSLVFGGTFSGVALGYYMEEFYIVIRLVIVFLNLGLLYKYIEKVDSFDKTK